MTPPSLILLYQEKWNNVSSLLLEKNSMPNERSMELRQLGFQIWLSNWEVLSNSVKLFSALPKARYYN